MSQRPYQRFSNDVHLNPTYMRYRIDADNQHPTVRFWIWIVMSSFFIILLGWATHFIDRCKESLVFDSLVFKFCVLFFILALASACYVLYRLREYSSNRVRMLKVHLWTSGILSITCCIVFLILFTVSIYPAFKEASIAFAILASLLVTNLGCLLLHD